MLIWSYRYRVFGNAIPGGCLRSWCENGRKIVHPGTCSTTVPVVDPETLGLKNKDRTKSKGDLAHCRAIFLCCLGGDQSSWATSEKEATHLNNWRQLADSSFLLHSWQTLKSHQLAHLVWREVIQKIQKREERSPTMLVVVENHREVFKNFPHFLWTHREDSG